MKNDEKEWDFEKDIPDIVLNENDDYLLDERGDYEDPEGEEMINDLVMEQENLLAMKLAKDDTFFYHPAAEEVLRYLHDWTWDTLNKSGYRMVVVYLWGERYSGKSRTLRQFKVLIHNILRRRIQILKENGLSVPYDLSLDYRNLKKSIVFFELPTGMDSDKRLFYTILVNKFGMKRVKSVYNSRTAFDFVRKLMEICLIHKIKVIIIDEFDRLENYGSAGKILNHLHYLSNGENWEDVYSDLRARGILREKPAFTRFILCGINNHIPLLDQVNWNDDRITEIKLDLLREDDTISLISKVVKYYQQKYGFVDWNLFEYNNEGDFIEYDRVEIDLLMEYSENKAGKLLELIKRAGVIAMKNNETTIDEKYYDFARLKTSYIPNIEKSISSQNKVPCKYCGRSYTARGISRHEKSCK